MLACAKPDMLIMASLLDGENRHRLMDNPPLISARAVACVGKREEMSVIFVASTGKWDESLLADERRAWRGRAAFELIGANASVKRLRPGRSGMLVAGARQCRC